MGMKALLLLLLLTCVRALVDVYALRRERLDAGLDEEGCVDTCSNPTATASMCACDASCELRGDCCVDVFGATAGREPSLRCTHSSGRYFYTVAACPEGWADEETRLLCKRGRSRNATYLQDVPVHSRRTLVLYRNIFCALCNGDVQNLSPWSVVLDCKPKSTAEAIRTGSARRITYSAVGKYLAVDTGGQRGHCRLAVQEVLRDDFVETYDASTCKLPPIGECLPNYPDEVVKAKCDSYTAVVYDSSRLLKYRNYHCALCNNRTAAQLRCKPSENFTDSKFPDFGISYSIVMDFSQWGNGGGDGPHNRCEPREVYDPMLRSCLAAACPLGQTWEEGRCTTVGDSSRPSEAEQTGIDCEWVRLPADRLQVLPNGSGLLTYRQLVLKPSHFEALNGSDEAIVCLPHEVHFKLDEYQGILSRVVLSISILCLFLHAAVYAALPHLRNRPGKILLCLSLSVLVAQGSFLAGGEWAPGSPLCVATAMASHLFHLAAFFWMNALAIDVHRTFRSFGRPPSASWAFFKYSIYACLGSSMIVVSSGLVGFLAPGSPWSPAYGSPFCWINRPWALAAYFAAPILVLLLANSLLFCLTAISISKTDQQVKVARTEQKRRVLLYTKLAVVFGLTWLFGFAAAFAGVKVLWYPFIILCGLQGAFIFLSFTCKRDIGRHLRQALCGKDAGKPRPESSNLTSIRTSLMTSSTALASIVTGKAVVDTEKGARRSTPTRSREGTPLLQRSSLPANAFR